MTPQSSSPSPADAQRPHPGSLQVLEENQPSLEGISVVENENSVVDKLSSEGLIPGKKDCSRDRENLITHSEKISDKSDTVEALLSQTSVPGESDETYNVIKWSLPRTPVRRNGRSNIIETWTSQSSIQGINDKTYSVEKRQEQEIFQGNDNKFKTQTSYECFRRRKDDALRAKMLDSRASIHEGNDKTYSIDNQPSYSPNQNGNEKCSTRKRSSPALSQARGDNQLQVEIRTFQMHFQGRGDNRIQRVQSQTSIRNFTEKRTSQICQGRGDDRLIKPPSRAKSLTEKRTSLTRIQRRNDRFKQTPSKSSIQNIAERLTSLTRIQGRNASKQVPSKTSLQNLAGRRTSATYIQGRRDDMLKEIPSKTSVKNLRRTSQLLIERQRDDRLRKLSSKTSVRNLAEISVSQSNIQSQSGMKTQRIQSHSRLQCIPESCSCQLRIQGRSDHNLHKFPSQTRLITLEDNEAAQVGNPGRIVTQPSPLNLQVNARCHSRETKMQDTRDNEKSRECQLCYVPLPQGRCTAPCSRETSKQKNGRKRQAKTAYQTERQKPCNKPPTTFGSRSSWLDSYKPFPSAPNPEIGKLASSQDLCSNMSNKSSISKFRQSRCSSLRSALCPGRKITAPDLAEEQRVLWCERPVKQFCISRDNASPGVARALDWSPDPVCCCYAPQVQSRFTGGCSANVNAAAKNTCAAAAAMAAAAASTAPAPKPAQTFFFGDSGDGRPCGGGCSRCCCCPCRQNQAPSITISLGSGGGCGCNGGGCSCNRGGCSCNGGGCSCNGGGCSCNGGGCSYNGGGCSCNGGGCSCNGGGCGNNCHMPPPANFASTPQQSTPVQLVLQLPAHLQQAFGTQALAFTLPATAVPATAVPSCTTCAAGGNPAPAASCPGSQHVQQPPTGAFTTQCSAFPPPATPSPPPCACSLPCLPPRCPAAPATYAAFPPAAPCGPPPTLPCGPPSYAATTPVCANGRPASSASCSQHDTTFSHVSCSAYPAQILSPAVVDGRLFLRTSLYDDLPCVGASAYPSF